MNKERAKNEKLKVVELRFLYNRLALITCYLLDIDLGYLAYFCLLKWNWINHGALLMQQSVNKINMISHNHSLVFRIKFIKRWKYVDLMEIWFYSSFWEREKNADNKIQTLQLPYTNWCPRKHSYWGINTNNMNIWST